MADSAKKTIIDTATELAESIRPQLEHAADAVMERTGPLLAEAKDKAGPMLAEARDKAGPILAEGRSLASEKAGQAAEIAAAGRDAAVAKMAELASPTVSVVAITTAAAVCIRSTPSTVRQAFSTTRVGG